MEKICPFYWCLVRIGVVQVLATSAFNSRSRLSGVCCSSWDRLNGRVVLPSLKNALFPSIRATVYGPIYSRFSSQKPGLFDQLLCCVSSLEEALSGGRAWYVVHKRYDSFPVVHQRSLVAMNFDLEEVCLWFGRRGLLQTQVRMGPSRRYWLCRLCLWLHNARLVQGAYWGYW